MTNKKTERRNIQKPHILLPVLVAILAIPVVVASAVDLPTFFDEPCIDGSPRDQAICIGVNTINDEQELQDIRITDNESDIAVLNATQILEQIEQDGNELQLVSQAAQLAAIPEILIKTKMDTNGLPCLDSGLISQPDWCPGGSARNFAIPDVDVTANSFVSVAIVGLGGDQIGCTVTDISTGEFHMRCFNTFDGNTLRYLVVN